MSFSVNSKKFIVAKPSQVTQTLDGGQGPVEISGSLSDVSNILAMVELGQKIADLLEKAPHLMGLLEKAQQEPASVAKGHVQGPFAEALKANAPKNQSGSVKNVPGIDKPPKSWSKVDPADTGITVAPRDVPPPKFTDEMAISAIESAFKRIQGTEPEGTVRNFKRGGDFVHGMLTRSLVITDDSVSYEDRPAFADYVFPKAKKFLKGRENFSATISPKLGMAFINVVFPSSETENPAPAKKAGPKPKREIFPESVPALPEGLPVYNPFGVLVSASELDWAELPSDDDEDSEADEAVKTLVA
jgi:hypothetical protein